MASSRTTYLLDANILIDYQHADLHVLVLFSQHVGDVAVVRDVVTDEVDDLSTDECEALNIQCLDPSLEQITRASDGDGGLSFYDLLCLEVADSLDAICVTNDRRLRRECTERGVDLRWGLQLMLELVECGGLSPDDAIDNAEKIADANLAITEDVLSGFRAKVSS
ncbi:MAG: hypothetical protein ACQEVA_11980 [Myxococcota bacterium]